MPELEALSHFKKLITAEDLLWSTVCKSRGSVDFVGALGKDCVFLLSGIQKALSYLLKGQQLKNTSPKPSEVVEIFVMQMDN